MNTKKVYKIFSSAHLELEARFLEEMARQGWEFSSVRGFAYRFTEAKPREVHYALVYGEQEVPDAWQEVYTYLGYHYYRIDQAEALTRLSNQAGQEKSSAAWWTLFLFLQATAVVLPYLINFLTSPSQKNPFYMTVYLLLFMAYVGAFIASLLYYIKQRDLSWLRKADSTSRSSD